MVCLVSAAALFAQNTPQALRFTRLSVKDPGINNIEAISFLIPAGWKAEGGVQWFPDYSILANLLMRISDPQTGATIEFLPVQLPSGYREAWVNGRGEYILSNDAGFNPNVGDTTEWRHMDRRDPRGP
jgi:hypothetical protein